MRAVLGGLLTALLAACAEVPQDRTPQRLPEAVLAQVQPAAATKLSLDELVALAKQGSTAETLIARLKASGARHDLSPSQVVDLHRRGLPLPVLDYLHGAWEAGRRDDAVADLNRRDQQCRETLERQRREMPACPEYPAYPPGWYDPWWPYGRGYWRR